MRDRSYVSHQLTDDAWVRRLCRKGSFEAPENADHTESPRIETGKVCGDAAAGHTTSRAGSTTINPRLIPILHPITAGATYTMMTHM